MARVSADERRRQLVAAAFRLIERDGFAGVTTRRVCAEADAPLAAFHYCFTSKQELLAELTTPSMAALLSAQREMPLRETVEATLRAGLRHYWKTVEDDPNRESVLMALTQHALATPRSTASPSGSTRPTTPPRARRCSASPGLRGHLGGAGRGGGAHARRRHRRGDARVAVDRDSPAAVAALDAFGRPSSPPSPLTPRAGPAG